METGVVFLPDGRLLVVFLFLFRVKGRQDVDGAAKGHGFAVRLAGLAESVHAQHVVGDVAIEFRVRLIQDDEDEIETGKQRILGMGGKGEDGCVNENLKNQNGNA